MTERQSLRLGAIPGATPDKWASRWRERFPQVPLEVVHADEARQLERLRSDQVDIGYVRQRADAGEGPDPEVFHRVVLYTEDPVVCASRDHWVAAAEESVDWEDIAEEPFLDPADMSAGVTDPEEIAAEERIALEVVASGAGLLLLPNSVARALSRKDVVIRRVEGIPGYDVGLCWRRDRDDEVIQEFIGVARGRRSGSGRSEITEKPRGRPAGTSKKAPTGTQGSARGGRAGRGRSAGGRSGGGRSGGGRRRR